MKQVVGRVAERRRFERGFSPSDNAPAVGPHAHPGFRERDLTAGRGQERSVPNPGTVARGESSIDVVQSDQGRYPLLRRHVQRHHALGGSRVAADVAVEDGHWHGRRQLESVTLALAL